jgi:phosphoglycolate phosphatase
MPPPLVIFDFDGTIADSAAAIVRTGQLALSAAGEAPVQDDAFVSRIGLPLAQIFNELVVGLSASQCDRLVALYRERYAEVSTHHATVFEGMIELLADLKKAGTTLAIATGKSTDGAHHALARLAIDASLFVMVVGTDAVARPKPHPDMVTHILQAQGVTAHNAWVVGDTTFDMEMSRAAGAVGVGVTWGSHQAHALTQSGAHHIAHTRTELREFLFA